MFIEDSLCMSDDEKSHDPEFREEYRAIRVCERCGAWDVPLERVPDEDASVGYFDEILVCRDGCKAAKEPHE